MVLAAGGDVAKVAVPAELEPIGGDFTLRNRGSQTPGRAHQHRIVSRPAQSAAGGAGAHQRLDQHRHRGVRRIQIVRRHVAQRARRPQRGPAAAHRGDEIGFAFEAEVALELAGKAGTVAILDQGGGPHRGQRAGVVDQRPPRREQRVEHSRRDRPIEQLELHPQRMLPRFDGIVGAERAARRGFQAERGDLEAIRLGIEADAARNRQPGMAERRQVCRLGTEAAGVVGIGRGKRNDQFSGAQCWGLMLGAQC